MFSNHKQTSPYIPSEKDLFSRKEAYMLVGALLHILKIMLGTYRVQRTTWDKDTESLQKLR